jgi:hypothetical protein
MQVFLGSARILSCRVDPVRVVGYIADMFLHNRLLNIRPLLLVLLASTALAQDRFERAPIEYSKTQPNNVVNDLQNALAAGQTTLSHDPASGYLKAVLDALKIPVGSQVLVYSKTSLQQQHITPENPRALYFNDDTYVGSVPGGGLIEISTADAGLGAVFYALDQRSAASPQIVRQAEDCMQCHGATLTGGYPGHIVRSVYTDAQGYPILKAGSHVTLPGSPFKQRWGGWYVTGTHGDLRHLGNGIATPTEMDAQLDLEAGANRTALDARVNASKYLTPHSDLVALMVLVHQAQIHNLMTQASFDARFALWDQSIIDEMLKTPERPPSESTQRRIANAADKLVDGLLGVDEIALTAPIAGTSGFAEVFSRQGPRDSQGRSLRDLDLAQRLFKYPLSYLIYTPQFEGLPGVVKDYVYQRLWVILRGEDEDPRYARITEAQRNATRQILAETKANLPAYWTAE